MKLPRSVVVVSLTPDHLNTNWTLRSYVIEGFDAILGGGKTFAAGIDTAEAVIAGAKPDLVVAFGSVMPDYVDLRALRRQATAAGAHLAVWLHDDPYELDFAFRVRGIADTVFTSDKGSVPFYHGQEAHHLPLAASPTTHFVARTTDVNWDMVFCGVGFENRVRILREIEDDLKAFRVCVLGAEWPAAWWLAKNRRVSNSELVELYGQSATTLNLGRDFNLANERYQLAASTPGPRTFEAAMAGCVQLFFATSLEIGEYFEAETEIIIVDDAREIPERLGALLREPARLAAMQERTQQRALAEHTYQHRVEILLSKCGK